MYNWMWDRLPVGGILESFSLEDIVQKMDQASLRKNAEAVDRLCETEKRLHELHTLVGNIHKEKK